MNTQITKAKKPLPSRRTALALMVIAGAAGVAVAWKSLPLASAKTVASPEAAVSVVIDLTKSAAIVNGGVISEAEISGLTAQGIDRAVALDRYINKVLAAELARKAYSADAESVLRGAEREVLSQLYIAKRTQEIKGGIKDEDVKTFYDKNVKAEDFSAFKVRYFATQEPKEAEEVATAVAAGKGKDVDAKFKPAKDGDGYTAAQELPYGLGQVVRTMKAGEYSHPLMLRNGIFVLRVDDIKVGQKPEQAKVAGEIKDLIVAQRLSDELTGARRSARVELK